MTNLQTFVISAPEYPSNFSAISVKLTESSILTSRRLIFNKASLPSPTNDRKSFNKYNFNEMFQRMCIKQYSRFGKGMYIRFSNLLLKASSMSHGKLVAAKTITTLVGSSLFELIPSI